MPKKSTGNRFINFLNTDISYHPPKEKPTDTIRKKPAAKTGHTNERPKGTFERSANSPFFTDTGRRVMVNGKSYPLVRDKETGKLMVHTVNEKNHQHYVPAEKYGIRK